MNGSQRIPILLLTLGMIWVGVIGTVNAQVIEEWAARYNGPDNLYDGISNMVLDSQNNVYVTGASHLGYAEYSFITIKYNTAGEELWVARHDGGRANDIAIDDDDNIYVTGSCYGDFCTIKYDSDGAEQWVAMYNFPGSRTDEGYAITLDEDGYVYIMGWHSWMDYVVIKYNAQGEEQWVAVYSGMGAIARDIAVDTDGNVYVTGSCLIDSTGLQCDYLTVKFDAEGQFQWAVSYNGSAILSDYATGIVLDESGNVYITGRAFMYDSLYDYTTIKYSPDGQEQWVSRYNGPANQDDEANAIAMDGDGFIYVTGTSAEEEGIFFPSYNYATVKYNQDGDEIWVTRYDGPEGQEDIAASITTDAENSVYVTGKSDVAPSEWDSHYEIISVKYDCDGQELWVANYAGPGNGDGDEANCIAVGSDGNVFVGGAGVVPNNGYDALTLMYGQPDIAVTITPYGLPIQIPASGGSFDYNVEIINNEPETVICDFWCDVTLPNGNQYGPVLGPVPLILSAGSTISRDRTQNVSGNAPAGIYRYNFFQGNYPDVVCNLANFPFEKLAGGDGEAIDEWTNSGDSFEGSTEIAASTEFLMLNCYPNPFNPSTVISFELRVASSVKLDVYNTNGCRVGVACPFGDLASTRLYPPGTHQITFDGFGLASGIYLYRVEAGGFTATGKMVLMK
ncbi:hypothetical protein CEE37_15075 [candidate division LCP-89 bacterium B3_LCP]|uniref:Secretion system C-terminal sorting domain-containing protein n=1 Tax=candidate division LCP-89 bacterium B3_LCP TaxID=2012998 RepID=A0A532UNQ8_UNCL8|nr:MAG: hypothetical protein CEE37_15075 [candidate division LCP-89 bacterium B3_LCP]